MHTRIKICCIRTEKEAQAAIAGGASAIGLVGKMPSGPGPIEDELIATIAKTIPPAVATFLLTSETSSKEIISHHLRTFTSTIQLVDELQDFSYQLLREELPAIKLVQVIHVIDESSLEEALQKSAFVDALLLDSGNPRLKIKELGGTGRVHNWNISRKITDQVKVPVFLAGGLTATNVREAINKVQPFGVDVCSGVRSNGALDERKLEAFIDAVIK
ncbi:MAG: phosphoribosylanthranilate isomerase [Ginsengibacter sp.]